jgi:PDZ domain
MKLGCDRLWALTLCFAPWTLRVSSGKAAAVERRVDVVGGHGSQSSDDVSVSRNLWSSTWTPVSNLPSPSPSRGVAIAASAALVKRTNRPSNSPSLIPSRAPSAIPFDSPSKAPSISPSASAVPTGSSAPTQSRQPTQVPSSEPSLSTAPTMYPTQQCHDQSSYRSPINDFECRHHNGTDCFEWRHLGLQPLEVQDLISSCPVSCHIICGSLLSFETNLTLLLSHVDNFLAPESTVLFEQTSAEYLTDYVVVRNSESRFLLYKVELLSQRILDGRTNRQRSTLRSLQERNKLTDLEATVAFRGFAVNMTLVFVETYLSEGIEAFGYTRALRSIDDAAFQRIQVSLASYTADQDPGTPAGVTVDNDDSASPALIAMSIIAAFGAVAIAVVMRKSINRNIVSTEQSEKDLDSQVVSPAASNRSPLGGNTLSFDSVLRFMSTSASPRSKSEEDATDRSSAASQEEKHSPMEHVASRESVEDEHPLTGLIPPMIVYDCIEDGDDNKDQAGSTATCRSPATTPQQRVVPSKQLAATPTFRAALHGHSREAIDESTFQGIIQSASEIDDESLRDVVPHATSYPSMLRTDSKRSIYRRRTSFGEGTMTRFDSNSKMFGEGTMPRFDSNSKIGSPLATRHLVALDADEEGTLPVAPMVKTSASGRDSPNGSIASAIQTRQSGESTVTAAPSPIKKFSPRRSHLRKSSSQSSEMMSSADVLENILRGERHVFDAPRRGKLGLVVQFYYEKGFIVAHVRESSPLHRKVIPGDRITEIDGIFTSNMTVDDVNAYLEGKDTGPSKGFSPVRRPNVLRIAVYRRCILEEAAGMDEIDAAWHTFSIPRLEMPPGLGSRPRSSSRSSTRSATPPPPTLGSRPRSSSRNSTRSATPPLAPLAMSTLVSPRSMTTSPRNSRKVCP